MGVGQRALSLSAHMGGGGDPLPTSGPGEGDVITPASFSGYTRYYWDVAATWNGWFFIEPSEREPQPLHSHWRSPSRALFPPLPSPVVLVAWITERGDDVVCLRVRSQRGYADTEGDIGYAL